MKTAKVMVMKFQRQTRTLNGNWARGHLCNILQKLKKKQLTIFCACPENLNEAEFRSNGFF